MTSQISGQISLFDIFKNEPEEAPILLNPGQLVYLVVRGDIEKYKVSSRTWNINGQNRGYDLFDINSVHHGNVTWNSKINVDTFYNFSDAELKANEYISKFDCILAKDIIPQKIVSYKHTYLGKEIYNWYAILNNDMVYFSYGSVYDHIGYKYEIKKFEQNIAKTNSIAVNDFVPEFKNMYKCSTDSNWIYAAANYQNFKL